MLNRSSNAAKTWVVVGVGALVLGLAAFFILFTLFPDSTFAQVPADPLEIDYDENGTSPVATFFSEDPEGAGVEFDVTGTDAADFMIDRSSGVLMFKELPNFESATDRGLNLNPGTGTNLDQDFLDDGEFAPKDNMYQITVRSTEIRGSGETRRALSTERAVTITVQNVDEPGVVELQWMQPEVHTEIMATLTDPDYPDGIPSGVRVEWSWDVSKVRLLPSLTTDNHWTDVTTATDVVTTQLVQTNTATTRYIPLGVSADRRADNDPAANPGLPMHEGKFLRAVAIYDRMPGDEIGEGDLTADPDNNDDKARGMSANPVRESRTTGNPLDENASPDFEPITVTIQMPEDAQVALAESDECNNNQSWCVGAPVVAKDPNRVNPTDILTYELVQPDVRVANRVYDVDFFTIDKATGQIKLAMTLDYEEGNDDREYGTAAGEATKAEYEFQVRATDPSGDSALADITVKVMDRNDAPEISGALELRVMEQDSDDLLPLNNPDGDLDNEYTGAPDMPERTPGGDTGPQANTYTASDEDAVDQISWDLGGEDGDKFILSADGVEGAAEPRDLMFRPGFTPDFEAPQDANGDNVYKLTVIAWDKTTGDSGRKMDEMAVTVIVYNQEETGRITLEAENRVGNEPVAEAEWEPFVDKEIIAAVDDPDQGVAIVTWQWSKSDTGGDDSFVVIPGETTATYTPSSESEDEGYYLRVTATYLDTYSGQEYPDDPDTTHDERVVEDAAGVAKDPVDAPTEDGLHGDLGLYRVTATSAFAVRVKDEGPQGPVVPEPPVCPDVTVERSVKENAEAGTFVGAPLMEMCENTEPDGYSLVAGVRDNDYFSIMSSMPARYILNAAGDGVVIQNDTTTPPAPTIPGWPQITVRSIETPDTVMIDPPLDYEAKGGAPFIVTVTATNDDGEDTFNVSITLEDLNESPWFNKASRGAASRSLMFNENSMDLVATYRATDPDMQSIVWELTGRDADDFTITGGVLRFEEAPDYENPTARVATGRGGATDAANAYMVTIRATEEMAIGGGPDRSDELAVTVMVQNQDENGKVSLSLLQPEVGTALMATASDPDGFATDNTIDYRWYRAKFDAKPALAINPDAFISVTDDAFIHQWEAITGDGLSSGTDRSYTPQGRRALPSDEDNDTPAELTDRLSHPQDDPVLPPVDEYRYLLVVATYEDATGAAKSAIGTSDHAVRRDVHDDKNSSVDYGFGARSFSIQEDVAGKGSRVGQVIVADEDDEGDIITYEIVAVDTDRAQTGCQGPNCEDVDFFTIDKAMGTISIKKALDHEADDGRDYVGTPGTDAVTAGEYVIIVRATDPSGETEPGPNRDAPNSDDIQVKVKVLDSNDAPKLVNGTVDLSDRDALALALAKNVELSVDEADYGKEEDDDGYYTKLGEGDGGTDENLFRKIDHDAGDAPKEWRLEGGPDASLFQIGTPISGIGRIIQFSAPPDYENPQDDNRDNVYEVEVVVIDNADAAGRIPVRVEVKNVKERGTLTLSPEEPTDGQEVTATLMDYDGVKSITSWMWEKRTSSTGVWEVISEATTDTVTGEVGDFLRATVEYRDGWSVEDDPITTGGDTNGDNARDRANDERNENDPRTTFGERPTADTPYDSDERLTAGLASVVRDPAVADPMDPDTGTGTPPPPPIVLTRHVYENVPGTGYVGDPILAPDKAAGYEVEDSGDGQYFTLAGAISGRYALSEDPDYYTTAGPQTERNGDTAHENRQAKPGQIVVHWDPVPALDAEAEKSSYTITVRDPNAPRKSPIELTIIVDDVNEAPSDPDRLIGGLAIAGKTSIRVNEGDSLQERYLAVGGAPSETAMWMLFGPDRGMFSIDSNGELTLNDVLDYEDPQDQGPVLNELQVTVELTFGDDSTSKFVTVTIVNMEEEGTITLTPAVPAIGVEIMADLDDADGIVIRPLWQWSRSDMEDGPWDDIATAKSTMYTPTEDDRDMYLRVVAMYDDGEGSNKMAKASGPVASVPTFMAETMAIMVAENTPEGDPVGNPVVAGAGMGAMLTYTLSGTDAAAFTIDDMGQIMVGTGTMLNYEATKTTYEVTVAATDQNDDSDSILVTIMVTNADEMGEVTLWTGSNPFDFGMAPQVDDVITGLVVDPDGGVTGQTWQWFKSMTPNVMTSWMEITGATSNMYTVDAGDAGYYLRATAMYGDGYGTGKRAYVMTASAVGDTTTMPPMDVVSMYAGEDGVVDRSEVFDAIFDFFDPTLDITRDDVLAVIARYFAGLNS